MGRPGGGGGRSSGGHSMGGSRSGGGSRPGGGSRSGGSFGGSRPGGSAGRGGARPGEAGPMGGAGGPMGGPGGPMGGPGGRPPRRGWFGRFFYGPRFGYGGYGYGGRGGCGCLVTIIIFLIFIVITVITGVVRSVSHSSSSSSGRSFWFSSDDNNSGYSSDADDISGRYSSDTTRERADTGVAFSSDCVIDELGWVEDIEATGEALESFYDATGVQPYIYLKAYEENLTTDSEKEAYAEEWYEDNIDNEGTFLYIYFAEEDSDNDLGYFVYVCGEDATSVMDDEALEIFWNYHEDYWYSDLSMDDMLVETFDSTAEAIMQ